MNMNNKKSYLLDRIFYLNFFQNNHIIKKITYN